MRLITLALGGAIGYVLGAKAGHGRYEQLMGLAKRMTKGQRSSMGNSGTGTSGSSYTPASSTTWAATGSTGASTSSAMGDAYETPGT